MIPPFSFTAFTEGHQFKRSIYCNALNRNFSFNQNFDSVTKLPPGTPMVTGVAALK